MGDLVANLLQFSRRSEEKISTVDIREELAKAVELIHHHLRKRQVTVDAGVWPPIRRLFMRTDRNSARSS